MHVGELRAPLGPTANRTCFLSGISGNLQTTGSLDLAGVNIWDNQAGEYFLFITNPQLHSIGASATCITGATNVTSMRWSYGFPSTSLGNSPNRRCFLSRVLNQHGMQQWSTDRASNGWLVELNPTPLQTPTTVKT